MDWSFLSGIQMAPNWVVETWVLLTYLLKHLNYFNIIQVILHL